MENSVFLVILFALPALCAGEEHNKLTADEVRAGWILLFDGETTFGWKDQGDKKAAVQNGNLELSHGATLREDPEIFTTSGFGDAELILQYRRRWDGRSGLVTGSKSIVKLIGTPNDWQNLRLRLRASEKYRAHLRFHLGFFSWAEDLSLRNLKLRPLKTKSLFAGKDLAGWKMFPGKKSKFTVHGGAIQLIDGPGDLQTEGLYRDFILQLECKTNGKHLNSGVFFRCKPGEYQNGYEAQIHNHFSDGPGRAYTIEEYDPVTHKLTEKKKVNYQAVDYGTGAIYRRQPARQSVARDGEWFTMTILAQGNHFATWVNGIQVTDWTDNRPNSDNPRNGFRREAGHISLQGHDPTTNLSFRNIRIAEVP